MKKKNLLVAFLLCLSLLIAFIYISAISSIPKSIIIFQGEKINLKEIFGISYVKKENKAILTSTTLDGKENNQEIGKKQIEVKLFNTFSVKNIDVSVIERTKVIPVGQVSGLKLYTSGVLVVGMSEIKGVDKNKYEPYKESGIKEGDTITEIEENEISDTDQLIRIVNSSKGKKLKLKYMHDGNYKECFITPIETTKNEYKIGLWVRDSAAGIGTMTYYEPKTNKFAALGHGITDIDTGDLLNISNGEFVTTKILSIIKGNQGKPGKIKGTVSDQKKIGTINKNSNFGIYGTVEDISQIKINQNYEMDVAIRNEIKLGEAEILCTLDEENVEKYKIQVEKIYFNNDYDNKSMLIKVTDKKLIEKTGGIIQGMSGSPVIQNGKFIGAVTNVLVNDPTKGFVVFGDIMVKEMKMTK